MTRNIKFRITLLLALSFTTYSFLSYKLSNMAGYIGLVGLALSPLIFTLYFITLQSFSKYKTLFKVEKIIWALFNSVFASITFYLWRQDELLFFSFPSSIATGCFIFSAALPFVVNIKKIMTKKIKFRMIFLLALSLAPYPFVGPDGFIIFPLIFMLYFITLKFFFKNKTSFKLEKIIWSVVNLAFAAIVFYLLVQNTVPFLIYPLGLSVALFTFSAALPFVINIKRN